MYTARTEYVISLRYSPTSTSLYFYFSINNVRVFTSLEKISYYEFTYNARVDYSHFFILQ